MQPSGFHLFGELELGPWPALAPGHMCRPGTWAEIIVIVEPWSWLSAKSVASFFPDFSKIQKKWRPCQRFLWGSCPGLPCESYVTGSGMMKEFTFGGMKVRLSKDFKEATKEFKILFIGIVYKATWKAMKKKAYIWLLCLPTFLHLRMRTKSTMLIRWSAMRRRTRFFTCCGNTRKQIFVIFNACKDMLQNVDESLLNHFPSTEVSIRGWTWLINI